ncbi:MAG: hypothetical protein LQ343_007369 [Gyalolechia ehrenbergii]|nr:MAG: hypothetical protein LQ343_007369 [Gyalolechia ehrenbergii]
MATLVARSSRRPALGELSSTRSNKLAMIKHIQIVAGQDKEMSAKYEVPSCNFNFASKVKRTFDNFDEDQENVDPATLIGSGKKAKGCDGAAVKPRQANFSLTTIKKPAVTESSKIARASLGVKARPKQSSIKPNIAGDAHKTKYAGIAARSRLAGKRIVRVGPYANEGHPPLITAPPSTSENISLVEPRVGKKTRKGMNFSIHEDTDHEESTNLLAHSTCTLDISDDENRGKFRDDCDKENIPPPGCPSSAVRPVGRREIITDEVRSPLAKLNAADYYAAGCDASSVINAPQEELSGSEPINLEFGSIDGKLHEDADCELNKATMERLQSDTHCTI